MKRVHSYNKKMKDGIDYSSQFGDDPAKAEKGAPVKAKEYTPQEKIAQHKRIIANKEKSSVEEGGLYNPTDRDEKIIKGIKKKYKIK